MIVRAPHCKTLTPLSVRPTLQCIGSSLKTFFYPVPNGATMKLSAFPANFPRRRHQSCFHSKTAKAYFSCQGQMEMSNSRSNIVLLQTLHENRNLERDYNNVAMLSKMFKDAINCDPVLQSILIQLQYLTLPITAPSRHQETSELGQPPMMSHLCSSFVIFGFLFSMYSVSR